MGRPNHGNAVDPNAVAGVGKGGESYHLQSKAGCKPRPSCLELALRDRADSEPATIKGGFETRPCGRWEGTSAAKLTPPVALFGALS